MAFTVLYDAECSLCVETKKLFQKLDWFHKTSWIPLQELKSSTISSSAIRKELHVIAPNGKTYKGYYAVRRIALFFPIIMPLAVIAYFPFADFLGVRLYKWVAKNRHRFLRKICDNGKCSL